MVKLDKSGGRLGTFVEHKSLVQTVAFPALLYLYESWTLKEV
jgi:hypothetical protein